MKETSYPLCWPANWKRTTKRARARFSTSQMQYGADGHSSYRRAKILTVADSLRRVQLELQRMGVREGDFIISTNIEVRLDGLPYSNRSEPSDPGAAIYWMQKGKAQCMAIDQYDRVADNLAAISATLNYLRGIERHGGGSILERAFIGFAALPAPAPARPWREVFGFEEDAFPSLKEIDAKFRELASGLHPDKPDGTHDGMSELNAARDAAKRDVMLS
jgi:hypothetical protein